MLIALSMLIFLLLRLTPGDPIDAYIDPNIPMSPAQLSELRSQLGLDQPLPVQYLAWLKEALTGNLGFSIKRQDQPVLGLVLSRIGPTVLLMGSALVIAIIAGIVTGRCQRGAAQFRRGSVVLRRCACRHFQPGIPERADRPLCLRGLACTGHHPAAC